MFTENETKILQTKANHAALSRVEALMDAAPAAPKKRS
jgi:hypothetical protein